jgi:hypothetical protein
MIKKFNEYNEESVFFIEDILSDEEVLDQFLKLKEVYDCNVIINHTIEHKYLIVTVYPDHGIETCPKSNKSDRPCDNKNISNIVEELKRIKHRIENIFPVKMYIEKDPHTFQPNCYFYTGEIKLKE